MDKPLQNGFVRKLQRQQELLNSWSRSTQDKTLTRWVGCKYPSTIAVEDALSIDSPLWRVLNDDIQPQSAVPYCLKRQLIDLFHTRKRCLEEIANTRRRNASDVQSCRGKVEGIGHLVKGTDGTERYGASSRITLHCPH